MTKNSAVVIIVLVHGSSCYGFAIPDEGAWDGVIAVTVAVIASIPTFSLQPSH